MYKRFFKRVIDFTITLIGFICILPIFLVLCILVHCKLGSPIFFKQVRITKGERPFNILKFRTMTNACNADGNLLPDESVLQNLETFCGTLALMSCQSCSMY